MKPGNEKVIKDQILTFLQKQELGVIATSSIDGLPEAATIGLKVDKDLNVLFLTKRNSRKMKNIEENPSVAIVIGTSIGLETVQLEGIAKIINKKDPDYLDNAMSITQTESAKYGPILKMEEDDYCLVKVKTHWARWLSLNEVTGKVEFYQLLPDNSESN